ncbi:YIP1 family protein [Chloroflexota bacterium]
MLIQRILGAFTFRKGIYASVEKDTSFTTTAWIIVAVVAFLNQLGSQATSNVGNWLIGAIVGTIFAILGFAVGALVINWVGRAVFKAEVTFHELVRTLGLAYVWQVIGVLGILASLAGCLLAPVMIAAVVLLIVAWLIAVREALDLDWVKSILTVVLGVLAMFVVMALGQWVLSLLGLGGAVMGGFLSS